MRELQVGDHVELLGSSVAGAGKRGIVDRIGVRVRVRWYQQSDGRQMAKGSIGWIDADRIIIAGCAGTGGQVEPDEGTVIAGCAGTGGQVEPDEGTGSSKNT